MRFSTKILLLTLAITVGLAATIVIVVRRKITADGMQRADEALRASAERYFKSLEALQKEAAAIVRVLLGDGNNRALLDEISPNASPEAQSNAREQFRYIFGSVQRELRTESEPPVFHALVDARGRTLVAAAVDNPELDAALSSQPPRWGIDDVLNSRQKEGQYLVVDGGLYLAFGLPLRQTQDEPPNFAYFCGFKVNDNWLNQLLGSEHDPAAVVTWFSVDDKLVACGSNRSTELGTRGERVMAAMRPRIHDAKPGKKASIDDLEVDGDILKGTYAIFEPAPGVRGVVLAVSSMNEQLKGLRSLLREIVFATAVAVAIAVIAARWIARRLAKPVEQLVEGTQRIAQGDFTHSIPVTRNDELGELARSFNEMALGLAQRDLIKDTLGQFVDPRIADVLLTNPASLRGQRVVQSILFSDIEKFTSISEKLPPEALVAMLNRFLGASADVVKSLNGYLDKFLGDGVIAFWGPPVEMNHSIAACRAGLRMIELSRAFQDPPLRVRIGIGTGEVLVGIIGSESSKKNYTAMGDVVNLASRLEGANKVYGTQILVDARTAAEVRDVLVTRRIDVVRVVGRAEPVELYEVLGEAGAVDAAARFDRYEQATALYKSRRWSDAREAFAAIDDAPSRVMSSRCESFIRTEPAGEWDGVWNLEVK